jgi:dolichyl-phosphate-mannose--protein O-mannosyl transferase
MDESLNQERELAVAKPGADSPQSAFALVRSFVLVNAAKLLCAALLVAMSLQMLAIISRKNITIDEIVMIPSAYYHLAAGNFQLVNEHPPLAKIFAAVPLLFVQPNEMQPDQIKAAPYSPDAKWAYQESFWEGNKDRFEAISFWARVPMIALAVILGLLIFQFARELFGPRAAVLAVALFSLEPTVLAHGRVVQTDIPAALGYLLLFYAIYHYVRLATLKSALWLGMAAAVAILAKFSMLIAGPIVAILFLALLWRGTQQGLQRSTMVAHASVVTLTVLIIINAAYFFQHRPLVEVDALWLQQAFPSNFALVKQMAQALSYILPTDFVMGILYQVWHNHDGHSAGLLGMFSQTGWWYYYPVAFVLKTTLPFLFLSFASLGWAAYGLIVKRDRRFLALLIPFAIYTVFVLFAHIDIGVRYYLPAYSFLFILGGALIDRMIGSRRAHPAGLIIAAAVLGGIGIETVRAYPNQISYINQFASAKAHWWYLSDSNVEWGDDARALALYLRDRGETEVRGAFLGGFLTLHHYGVGYVDMLPPEPAEIPRTHYVAIGASYLNGSTVPIRRNRDGSWPTETERVNFFAAYRTRTPEAVFGNSIYLYREDDQ